MSDGLRSSSLIWVEHVLQRAVLGTLGFPVQWEGSVYYLLVSSPLFFFFYI